MLIDNEDGNTSAEQTVSSTPEYKTEQKVDKRASKRMRKLAILWHRYVGLAMAMFLLVAGSTGVLLAFNDELDAWINPELFDVHPSAPNQEPLSGPELFAAAQSNLPEGVKLTATHFSPPADEPLMMWIANDEGAWRQWFIHPYNGDILGSREWGNLAEGKQNLMPFIYRLHYTLGLGLVGTVLMGLVALLWTIDCFVAIYLTFPAPVRKGSQGKPRPWLFRWKTSWLVRAKNMFMFVFTWHRASGVWIWGFLLIFAWSAVSLNLPPIYQPIMGTVTGMKVVGHHALPHLPVPYPEPKLSFEQARVRGQQEMAREAKERGFDIVKEQQLYWAADHGVYGYVVESTLDISKKKPWTEVYIDGQTGAFVDFYAPTGITSGNTFTSWIQALHMASVFGLWYQVLVSILGVLVTALTITGVWIWWKKRPRAAAHP